MRRDSPGQGTAPSLECADKNSLPGTFPAGCLCHFRCGLYHGADCSPESTGCDSQLTFSINPLFCGPSSGTSRGTVFFMGRVSAILEPENGGGDDDAEYAAGPGDSGGGADLRRSPGTRWCAVLTRRTAWIGAKLCGCGAKKDRGREKPLTSGFLFCRNMAADKEAEMFSERGVSPLGTRSGG